MKRIRELIELAYETGWNSAAAQYCGRFAQHEALMALNEERIPARNAARDALETDLQAALDAMSAALNELAKVPDTYNPAHNAAITALAAALAKFD